MMINAQISIIVPVYNAADCLHELHRRLVTVLAQLNLSYEIILIDDSSKDESWKIIENIASQDSHVLGYKLSRNFGQHHAITAGLDMAVGECVVIMDCDLQDRPEDIPLLLAKNQEGYDVVIARWKQRNDGLAKRVSALVFYRVFSWFTGYHYDGGNRSFRLLSRAAADALCSMREQFRSTAPLNNWIGFETIQVELAPSQRAAGKSSYNVKKLIYLAITNIISFSDKPLKIFVSLGLAMAGGAFVYGSYTWINALIHDRAVSGWGSLITSLYFIGGLILTNLGVLSMYLARTFEETKARPLYIIARRTVLLPTRGQNADALNQGSI